MKKSVLIKGIDIEKWRTFVLKCKLNKVSTASVINSYLGTYNSGKVSQELTPTIPNSKDEELRVWKLIEKRVKLTVDQAIEDAKRY